MRTLLFLVGLYVVHRIVLQISPAYRARMQSLDRQLSWVSLVLVGYLVLTLIIRLMQYMRYEE